MTSTKITKKSADTVQLNLDVLPQSKQLLEALRKKFELKTKAKAFEKIIEQAAVREKIPELREKDLSHQILLGIEFKLDRLLERFEEVL